MMLATIRMAFCVTAVLVNIPPCKTNGCVALIDVLWGYPEIPWRHFRSVGSVRAMPCDLNLRI